MKFSLAASLVAVGTLATAQHHRHLQHRHLHPRGPNPVLVPRAEETVYAYELDGQPISPQNACDGIRDGKLRWAGGEAPPGACSMPNIQTAEFYQIPTTPTTSSWAPITPTTSTTSSSSPSTSSTTLSASLPAYTPNASTGESGLDCDFPDGEIDCSTFPSQYGPISLEYLGLGGWSGLQQVTIVGATVSNIVTGIDGETCQEGYMCSYACPPGYQKSQWPSTQGSTGQSVGGLECKNGKLHLTNPSLSQKLCITGVGGVSVENTLSQLVSVCRTDYPGTEDETIPLGVNPGATEPLTCPDGSTYYIWEGHRTSAQYYINKRGVQPSEACQWGNGSQDIGNWAPVNLGVGMNDGKFLSLAPNTPTTTGAKLDFNVRIDGGSSVCKYENGAFQGDNGPAPQGCTVEIPNGSDAVIVFY